MNRRRRWDLSLLAIRMGIAIVVTLLGSMAVYRAFQAGHIQIRWSQEETP